MSDEHKAPGADDAGAADRDEELAAAEAIEAAIVDAPSSIEAEQLLEAAEIEELEAAPAPPPPTYPLPDDPTLAGLGEEFPSCEISEVERPVGLPEDVATVPAADYLDFMEAVRDAGFEMFVDLCGVDYLRRKPRFEVVVNVVSIQLTKRLRVRVGVEANDPTLPSICSVYPGANFFERETYDLLGISFEGHPDLTRILMPDDWEGHPLRKDYAVGSVPVQFKEAHKAT